MSKRIAGIGANLALLAGFLVLARWHLGLFPAGMFEDDAFFYLQIARNLALTGAVSFDGISATNGVHPLWLGVLASGAWLTHAAGLPVEAGLVLTAGLPLLGFAILCPPLIFAAILAAVYLSGFGMEGVLGALLFTVLSLVAERGWRWSLALIALALVLCRIDFLPPLSLLALWFTLGRRRLVLPLCIGMVAGIAASFAANWAMAGEILSISAAQKLGESVQIAGLELLQINLSTPGNLLRFAIYAAALTLLVTAKRPRVVLTAPTFHLCLASFLALHANASALRDWYFSVPVLTALAASALVITQGRRAWLFTLLCLLLPVAATGAQMTWWHQESQRYRSFLDGIERSGPPLMAYDGSGYIAFRLYPRAVINGDGLVNSSEFAQHSSDPEWLAAYLARNRVAGFLTNPSYPGCPAPRFCCPSDQIREAAGWQSQHRLLADRLWLFDGDGIACALRPR